MKISHRKKFVIIGICLLAVIAIFSMFLFNHNADDNADHQLITENGDNRLITGNREELMSITIQLRDKKGNTEKPVVISDQMYMYSIYDHLSSTDTAINKDPQPIEGDTKILFTYWDQSDKQDVVFWGADNSFYRCDDNSYVLGQNAELNDLLTGLFENVELEMVSEDQPRPQKITIHEYEGGDVKSTVSLNDTESINDIFSNLETIETKAVLYPNELSAFELDTEYELILEYEDQENIVIFNGTETPATFYRYSQTVSSSGEQGYVFGENLALYEFIVTLFENH